MPYPAAAFAEVEQFFTLGFALEQMHRNCAGMGGDSTPGLRRPAGLLRGHHVCKVLSTDMGRAEVSTWARYVQKAFALSNLAQASFASSRSAPALLS